MAASQVWPAHRNRARSKSTFELNLYLLPAEERLGREFVRRALHWLRQMDIVDGYYDVGLGWHAPGLGSWGLIGSEPPEHHAEHASRAFEYLIVHEGPRAEFVPNAHTGPFGARCGCGSSLDEAVYEYLARQSAGRVSDALQDILTCQRCGKVVPLAALPCEIETAVTSAYLNFCHLDSDSIAPEVLTRMEELAGGPLKQVRERL